MRQKNLNIREDQQTYLEENHLNFSKLVRELLDEHMEEEREE